MYNFILRRMAAIGVLKTDYIATYKDRFPKEIPERDKELSIVGNPDLQKWACLNCPGGCGARIALSLNPNRRPSWSVRLDWLRRPSIHPSVHQKNDCGCHFWVQNGRVRWCKGGKPQTPRLKQTSV